jgi:hypothetical protein
MGCHTKTKKLVHFKVGRKDVYYYMKVKKHRRRRKRK